MILLALDLGTTTGLAVGATDGPPRAWHERLGDGGPGHGRRFSYLLNFMNDVIRDNRPDRIAIEKAIASGAAGSEERVQLAMGFRACVMAVGQMRGVPVLEFPIQTIRKHFIGHGNLPRPKAKSETVLRCKRLRWAVETEDEADACAVWDMARWHLTRAGSPPPMGLFDV